MPRKTNLPNRIISCIKDDPFVSRVEISRRLKVSYQAVQKHLRIFEKKKAVLTGFIVSKELSVQAKRFWILIETRYHDDNSKDVNLDYQSTLCKEITAELIDNDEFSSHLSLADIQILLGTDWDILLSLHADNEVSVGKFVTRYLRTRKQIVRTSTGWSIPINNSQKNVDSKK